MSVENNKKAILWDLDGTILDSLSVFLEMMREVYPKYSLPMLEREDVRQNFFGSLRDSLERMSPSHDNHDQLTKDMLEAQLQYYDDPLHHDGMLDLISGFHESGFLQAIVTSRANEGRGKGGAREIVKTLGLSRIIEVVVSAEDSQHHKPHPEPLLLALGKLGVAPQNAIMIGDQPVDAKAAHAAGTHSIIIDHENTPHSRKVLYAEHPDFVCHDAGELQNLVNKIFGQI